MSPFLEENSVGIKLCPLIRYTNVYVSQRLRNKKGVVIIQGGGGGGEKGGERRRRPPQSGVPKNDERREESGFGGFGGEKKQRLLGRLLGLLRFFLSHVFGFRGYVNARERDEELEK